jgi:hypothetical protein
MEVWLELGYFLSGAPLRQPARSNLGEYPAVDSVLCPGQPARTIGGEERDQLSRISRASRPAHRHVQGSREVALRFLEGDAAAIAGADTVEGRMRGRLAVSVLVMADARGREVGGRLSERRAAALRVARELIS